MTTCRRDVTKKLDPIEIGRQVASGGTAGAQTAIVYVVPGSPLLRVAIEVYFRPLNPGGAIPSTGVTWSLAPGVREQRGDILGLQNVFTGRTLPDGWEVQTAAEVLVATASIQSASSENGSWFCRVTGKLTATDLNDQEVDAIMSALVAERGTPLRLMT